jgi:hypothetical protein
MPAAGVEPRRLPGSAPKSMLRGMTETPDNLVLALLRRLDERTARIEDRLATIERRLALRDQEGALDRADLLSLAGRVARIERRLDLSEG